ncbi:uncharacterized protein LOC134289085 [Aedes albopictus]|uniref:Helix-turn-helix domain-containing protein n=1 Tax=Aedes albopictus TaxID=7160 RepID=A0ABM1ZY15_AEDAL
MKMNVAANFIERVMRLTTDGSTEQQKQKIFHILRLNNYPSSLINRLINRIPINCIHNTAHQAAHPTVSPNANDEVNSDYAPLTQQQTSILPPTSVPPNSPPPRQNSTATASPPLPCSSTTTSAPNILINDIPAHHQATITPVAEDHHQTNPVTYRSMPHIPMLTRTISNILKKDYNNVKIATRNIKTTKTLLKPVKDPIPPLDQNNVIYSIPCNDCNNVYIGMTTNHLKRRICGHRSDINKLVNQASDNTQAKTALTQHITTEQHTFNLDNTKIVDRTFRSTALPMLEMCHIQNTPNTVNYRTDVDGLNTTYAGILHTIKTNLSRTKPRSNNDSTTTYNLGFDQNEQST